MERHTRLSTTYVLVAVFSFAIIVLGLTGWWLFTPQKHTVIFSSGSPNGLYHKLALAIENVVEQSHPEIDIVVKNSGGSSVNLDRIDNAECDLAMVQNDAMGGEDARSIASLYPEILHLVCRQESEIDSLGDLTDKTVNVGIDGSGTQQVVQALFEFISVQPEKELQLPFMDAAAALNDGTIDAAFFLTGVPGQLMDELLKNNDLELVPVLATDNNSTDIARESERFVRGFQTRYPFVAPQTLPMMTYHGLPKEPVPTLGVSAVLIARKDLASSMIQEITKTLFDRRVDLANRVSVFSKLNEENSIKNLRFPIHEGAEAYYRRREPNFLSRHAEAMGFIVTIILLLWSGVAAAKKIVTKERKNYIDTFYAEIDSITDRIKEIVTKKELADLEHELLAIDERIRKDLIAEQVQPDESFLIFQNMYQNCTVMVQEKRKQLG